MGVSNVTDAVLSFAAAFKKLSGKDLIIYSYTSFINSNLDNTLADFNAWIADYGVATLPGTLFKNVVGWQYTSNGAVAGLTNQLDLVQIFF